MLVPDLAEAQIRTMKEKSELFQIAPVAGDAVVRQTPLDCGVIQKVGNFRRNVGKWIRHSWGPMRFDFPIPESE